MSEKIIFIAFLFYDFILVIMCPLSMGNFDETSSIWTGTVAWAVCGGVGGVGCVESSKHIWGGGAKYPFYSTAASSRHNN